MHARLSRETPPCSHARLSASCPMLPLHSRTPHPPLHFAQGNSKEPHCREWLHPDIQDRAPITGLQAVQTPYMGRWAWIPTVLAVAWEAGRQCGLSYPLSGTIALTGIGGILLLCRSCMRRSWKSGLPVSILAVLSGYWLFGCGDWSSRWYNMPDLGREYLLALDSEMYFGRSAQSR
jgi:hypothetical protein